MTLSVVKSPASIDLSATGPTCDPLAFTGAPIAALVALGAALLVVGILLTVTARDRRARRVVFVTAVMIGAAIVAGGADSHQARAAEPPCSAAGTPDGPIIEPLTPAAPTVQDAEAQSPFQIGQISTNVGIAPGVAPTPITGRIANNGPQPIYLTAITVEISRVTTVPGLRSGACDSTDYDLHDPVMPVEVLLAPGESTTFTGASIGFHNKPINQDACQAATVGLLFRTS